MSVATAHPLGENYEACTGCGACAAKCPRDCIRLAPDAEGFLHPQIRLEDCVDCGLCREVCPVNAPLQQDGHPREPRQVLAAWHLDERIRRESSSGGAFTALAHAVFGQGGVVVGAAFDEDLVVRHVLIDAPAQLHSLRGSKYVQSEIPPELYRSIHDLLGRGRTVLFSGTPCQVAGLRRFLGAPSERLLCCDLVCKGVPSPLLLASYLRHNKDNGYRIARISFRDKTCGWKTPSVREHLDCGGSKISDFLSANPYTVAFVKNYSLRPACYACRFTTTDRTGDLTIADFWGVGSRYPQYDRDDKGTSLILVNTETGQKWLDRCRERLFFGPADLETALARNPMLWRPAPRPPRRGSFYKDLLDLPFSDLVRRYRLHPPSLWQRSLAAAKRKVKRMLRRFLKGLTQPERRAS